MQEIRLRGFRCFRDQQTARLAPLTLLVGENSTGKTSFMALVRALWDLGHRSELPDFKEAPYDLGSFDEIAHHRGGRGGRETTFDAGCAVALTSLPEQSVQLDVTFGRDRNQPALRQWRVAGRQATLDFDMQDRTLSVQTRGGRWRVGLEPRLHPSFLEFDERRVFPWPFLLSSLVAGANGAQTDTQWTSIDGPEHPAADDLESIQELAQVSFRPGLYKRPYASAPVRSKPKRTYDPSRLTRDPEGEAVPMYLADIFHRGKARWTKLQAALEEFGRDSGLFDEMRVRRLGKSSSEPFQIQVRKSGSKSLKGPWRNLTDVGYGVSQVLPVITELLRPDPPGLFLLQQPEVHLHPSAQAALGSLFCAAAAAGRQLIVETHGDHLLDRVRMDVRDGTTKLKAGDVSILYFEREALEVQIHSLWLDDDGNVKDAPNSYRRFFLKETQRSLGL